MPSLWDLRRTWADNQKRFSEVANFRFATLGFKERGGSFTRERALKIYVERKIPKTQLMGMARAARVPRETKIIGKDGADLGALAMDVCDAPEIFRDFGIRSGHAVLGFDNDRGVCALSFLAGGRKYLLTNAHVVMDIRAGGRVGPVAVQDRTSGARHVVGKVVHATGLQANGQASSDVAVVEVDPVFRIDDFMTLDTAVPISKDSIGGLRSLSTTEYRYNVNGQIFAANRAEPVMGFAPVRVDGVIVNYARCWLLHMTQGTGVPGHSGALLYRMVGGNLRASGLVFAGSEANRTILAFPFEPIVTKVEAALGAEID